MAFEADHGLPLDGTVGPQVWRAMFRALARAQMNPHGYTYALASQKLPETLTVWHNGAVIFHHLASPTARWSRSPLHKAGGQVALGPVNDGLLVGSQPITRARPR